uniref:USP domain-containing protein n=1 Tax=viral metagenome TaxID=1070528 RepID=A0A6C0IZZ5_9ZZZZ
MVIVNYKKELSLIYIESNEVIYCIQKISLTDPQFGLWEQHFSSVSAENQLKITRLEKNNRIIFIGWVMKSRDSKSITEEEYVKSDEKFKNVILSTIFYTVVSTDKLVYPMLAIANCFLKLSYKTVDVKTMIEKLLYLFVNKIMGIMCKDILADKKYIVAKKDELVFIEATRDLPYYNEDDDKEKNYKSFRREEIEKFVDPFTIIKKEETNEQKLKKQKTEGIDKEANIDDLTKKYEQTLNEFLNSCNLISGPVSFIYHQFNRRNIFLLGDQHGNGRDGDCTIGLSCDVVDFLDKVFRESTAKVDFYIEHMFMKDDEKAKHTDTFDALKRVRRHFSDCLVRNKKNCHDKYPNVRFHYTDIRDYMHEDFSNPMFIVRYGLLLNTFSKKLKKYKEGYKETKILVDKLTPQILGDIVSMYLELDTLGDIGKFISNKLQLSSKNELESYLKVALEFKYPEEKNRVLKQLKLSEKGKEIKTFIKEELQKYLQTILQPMYNDYISRIKTNNDNEEYVSFLPWYAREIQGLGGFVMDAYLLSRMFKPSLNDSKDIYIYVGIRHAERYDRFFSKLGTQRIEGKRLGRLPEDSEDLDTSNYACVDIGTINKALKQQPQYDRNPTLGYINTGVRCYNNALYKCLYYSKPLISKLKEIKTEFIPFLEEKAKIDKLKFEDKLIFFNNFYDLINKHENSLTTVIDTVHIFNHTCKIMGNVSAEQQQDASELLGYILDKFIDLTEKTHDKFSQQFLPLLSFKYKEDLIYPDPCVIKERTNYPVLHLLNTGFPETALIKWRHDKNYSLTLRELLQTELNGTDKSPCPEENGKINVKKNGEIIEDRKIEVEKRIIQRFIQLPQIFIIVMKKFIHNIKTNSTEFYNINVKIPEILDLTEFISITQKNIPSRYQLYAMVNYSGSGMGGHYTATIKNPFNQIWYYHNDTEVNRIIDNKPKLDNNPNIYILFYQRNSQNNQ